ncbi:hypothetical protein ACIBQX_30430 [Nonomuraea sp. NPDC049714]|uniref:hypothetical protein n=1 Tax=Nonomuraea sp. NPDC049714 TaxID=3364357 RepID=UPI0037BD374F
MKPASVNFGLTPQNPLIDCEPTNSATLKTYPLTIGGTGSTTPTADEDETDEEPTPQESEDEPTTRSSQTPEEGVATGAGGEAGPDGRMQIWLTRRSSMPITRSGLWATFSSARAQLETVLVPGTGHVLNVGGAAR